MNEQFDIRQWMFRYRSYTPIPFLILMIVFAASTAWSLLIGLVILLLGEAIRFWGVSIAGAETRTTGAVGGTYLITTGPFAYVRNPLYVGNMTMYAGLGVMSLALFPWLLIVAMVWFYVQYTLIVSKEEEYLRDHFGEQYREYCGHVRRFLPRLTAYRSASPPPKRFSFGQGIDSERRTLQAMVIVVILLLVRYAFFPGGLAG
jgi:protein-S-isoprenylcysteine O-methyltransferase Ste14